MNTEQAMYRLYQSEINCGLESFWDAGVTAWIGDEMNGRKATQHFDTEDMNKVGDWMINEAKKLYPLAFVLEIATEQALEYARQILRQDEPATHQLDHRTRESEINE